MEEMIDFCAPMMAQSNPGMTQIRGQDAARPGKAWTGGMLKW